MIFIDFLGAEICEAGGGKGSFRPFRWLYYKIYVFRLVRLQMLRFQEFSKLGCLEGWEC